MLSCASLLMQFFSVPPDCSALISHFGLSHIYQLKLAKMRCSLINLQKLAGRYQANLSKSASRGSSWANISTSATKGCSQANLS